MALRLPYRPFMPVSESARKLLETVVSDTILSRAVYFRGSVKPVYVRGCVKLVQTRARISFPKAASENKEILSSNFRNKNMVPSSDPPSSADISLLSQFFDKSSKLVVLTGAGISTECGIPDYRSPSGAYSTGFRPITHQVK